MKCPYCAEQIQDDALICRYCMSVKENGVWQRPVPVTTAPKGPRFTIRTAAVFFIISAFFEFSSISQPIPLFGAVRDGGTAFIYHILFMSLYLGMGVSLWVAKPWGYQFLWGGTIFYTLERLLALLMNGNISTSMSELGPLQMLGADGQGTITFVTQIAAIISIAGWWGFLLYLYLKRDYFQIPKN